mmetsp:Transcript_30173/g.97355  ORF Transcript_30173/g.97355 Transcript_30173/m.97355 type:complete len:303 (-) Transcript_30173:330-1238(-)
MPAVLCSAPQRFTPRTPRRQLDAHPGLVGPDRRSLCRRPSAHRRYQYLAHDQRACGVHQLPAVRHATGRGGRRKGLPGQDEPLCQRQHRAPSPPARRRSRGSCLLLRGLQRHAPRVFGWNSSQRDGLHVHAVLFPLFALPLFRGRRHPGACRGQRRIRAKGGQATQAPPRRRRRRGARGRPGGRRCCFRAMKEQPWRSDKPPTSSAPCTHLYICSTRVLRRAGIRASVESSTHMTHIRRVRAAVRHSLSELDTLRSSREQLQHDEHPPHNVRCPMGASSPCAFTVAVRDLLHLILFIVPVCL